MLVLTFSLAVTVGVLVEDFRLDDQISRERESAEALNRTRQSAQLALSNLRAAQAAYFAIGQDPGFWQTRATELSAALEQSISDLQAAAGADAARPHYEAAMAALGSLNGLDQKARDDLEAGASRPAATAIFSDATTSAQRLDSELSAAQADESTARDTRIGALRRLRLRAEAAAVGSLLAVILALGVSRRAPRASPAPEKKEATPAPPVPRATTRVPPPARPALGRPEVADAAQICVDLARVLDSQDLPPLLERAAAVLGAKGIVLWVADAGGGLLHPSLAHGYSDRVLERLGPLRADADNVTSMAFRSMQAQSYTDATRGATNAIAVPLIAPTGCTGVLAAEIGQDRGGPDTVSIAKIFAAQLATFITPTTLPLGSTAEAAPVVRG